MDRLTDRNKELPRLNSDNAILWAKVYEKLAQYEDTELEPEEIEDIKSLEVLEILDIDRAREIAKAEEENRLVVLPCKVGDIVWALWNVPTSPRYVIYQAEVKAFGVGAKRFGSNLSVWLEPVDFRGRRKEYLKNDFGKTVFLTREEAEKALEAEK